MEMGWEEGDWLAVGTQGSQIQLSGTGPGQPELLLSDQPNYSILQSYWMMADDSQLGWSRLTPQKKMSRVRALSKS